MSPKEVQTVADILIDPRESLGVELKQWFDPATDEGKTKLVKACLALRNNNGGRLIIGIKDDGRPDSENVPVDIRTQFHGDALQEVVARYASEPFEVTVEFAEHFGMTLPIITVPAGIKSPVACKSDLTGNNGALLRCGALYVRTLHSNYTVSSSAATYKDWPQIIEHCFNNREADIGEFLRRQLADVNIPTLAREIVRAIQKENNTFLERELDGQPAISLGNQNVNTKPQQRCEDAESYLDEGFARFKRQVLQRDYLLDEKLGLREAAVSIVGELPEVDLDYDLLWRLHASAPRLTGWPPWVVLSDRAPEDQRPYVLDEGWEAFLNGEAIGPYLDFWRIEPSGRFYHLRGLQDDLPYGDRSPEPYTSLDFLLQITRPTELLATAFSFAKTLGCEPAKTSLSIAIRWRNLKGRVLTSWVEPSRYFRPRGPAVQNQIVTRTLVPLETPPTAIAPYIERLVKPVFALFEGMSFNSEVIAKIVQETLSRRM